MKGTWKTGWNYCLRCDRDAVGNGERCGVCGWYNKANKQKKPNQAKILLAEYKLLNP